MKKIFLLFVAVAGLITFQSCEGPQGPPGYDGAVPVVYDVKTDLIPNNDFQTTFNFSIPLYDEDIVLVYFLDAKTDNGTKVWRMLPQKYYIDVNNNEYEVDYNFDFTRYDFRLFLSSNYPNIDIIGNGAWTRRLEFRAVVLEGAFGNSRIASSQSSIPETIEYETLAKKYNIKESDVIRLN
ncbi:hypothetical protein [Myroides guanonis]|uniref:Uncharacterized protein n=1 Tax=Myroides guanonis TaxID=1150112 RepID=A0A1I3LD33_9FLAO|nr:hypothetical protein [Myroides guanonis]SFI82669.1 hypothetical protein SAMN04487893_101272 [Myroides guanonis]